jgi:hypothetical protein
VADVQLDDLGNGGDRLHVVIVQPVARVHLESEIVREQGARAQQFPFGLGLGAAPIPLLLALIVIFALGILLSMSLFGVALAHVLSASALSHVADGAGLLVGAASVALGVAWIVAA